MSRTAALISIPFDKDQGATHGSFKAEPSSYSSPRMFSVLFGCLKSRPWPLIARAAHARIPFLCTRTPGRLRLRSWLPVSRTSRTLFPNWASPRYHSLLPYNNTNVRCPCCPKPLVQIFPFFSSAPQSLLSFRRLCPTVTPLFGCDSLASSIGIAFLHTPSLAKHHLPFPAYLPPPGNRPLLRARIPVSFASRSHVER